MKKHSIRRWIILCFTGIFFFSLAISAVANYLENLRGVTDRAEEEVKRCASVTHMLLEEIDFNDLLSEPDGELYNLTRASLWSLAYLFHTDSILVYSLDPRTQVRNLIFSVAADPETDAEWRKNLPAGSTLESPLLAVEEKWVQGEPFVYGSTRNGPSTTWTMTTRDSHSGLDYMIAIDISARMQEQAVLKSFLWNIIPIGLALLLGLVILLILVRHRIIRPIQLISESMNRFAGDGSRNPGPLPIRFRDEIGGIAASYAKMTTDIRAYVNSIEALTRDKLENDVQLDVARRIQYGLVPQETNLEGEGFQVRAMSCPARAVGGDFYDVFRQGERVYLVMGDVSGKGVSAAIFMAMAKTVIRERLMAGLSPAASLEQTNDELCGQNPEGLFATAFAAVMDIPTGEVVCANAGHNPPVLLSASPALLTPPPGIALGLYRHEKLEDITFRLGPSEGILLYTDGVTEAVSPRKEFFGTQRLLETLKTDGPRSAGDMLTRVREAVSSFRGGGEPFDDMAILALLRVREEDSTQAIPVALSSFDTVREAVCALCGDTPQVRRALLACDEALSNITHYSHATELSFSCKREGDVLRVSFSDNGIPFDPTLAPSVKKEPDELDSGGMGLGLMRQVTSAMHYLRRQGKNELTLSFSL